MENFKVGDRVVCVDVKQIHSNSLRPSLVLNREYIVYGVLYCPTCRTQAIDVGLASSIKATLCINGHRYERPDGIHWCSSWRFRKVAEKVEYVAVAVDVEIKEPVLN
jgi:hypothetical protein